MRNTPLCCPGCLQSHHAEPRTGHLDGPTLSKRHSIGMCAPASPMSWSLPLPFFHPKGPDLLPIPVMPMLSWGRAWSQRHVGLHSLQGGPGKTGCGLEVSCMQGSFTACFRPAVQPGVLLVSPHDPNAQLYHWRVARHLLVQAVQGLHS